MRALLCLGLMTMLSSVTEAKHPKWHQLDGYTFQQFKTDFGKRYDPSEDAMRQQVFETELAVIKKHNAATDRPSQSWRMGVNEFSDWTMDEWSHLNNYQDLTDAEASEFEEYTLSAAQSAASLPSQVDYRTHSPPVLTAIKSQGHCGSCYAHSATEAAETHFALLTGELPVLSQQQLTSCSGMKGCGGGNFWRVWEYIQESAYGLWSDWNYPYVEFFGPGAHKDGTQACRNLTAEYPLAMHHLPVVNVSAVNMLQSNNAASTMQVLAQVGPLSISVAAKPWKSYEEGILHNKPGPNEWEIDHAVMLVGYGFDDVLQEGYFLVRNSWGARWGEAGYIKLWRPVGNQTEQCGYGVKRKEKKICGTSGLLVTTGFPTMSEIGRP